jgi:HSP20 family protein
MFGVTTDDFSFGFPFVDAWGSGVLADMTSCVDNFSFKFPLSNVTVDKKTGIFEVMLALAGYKKEDITVTAESRGLTVEGKAPVSETKENTMVLKHGIRSSDFSVFIPIEPEYDLTKVKVVYCDGILTLDVPLSEDKKPRTIDIK